MWTNPGEIPDNGVDDDANGYVDDYYGYDFYNDDGDPFDTGYQCGHSTHVSGIIAAKGNNSIGVAGVSWNTKIAALQFLAWDSNWNGCVGDGANAIDAILYAAMMGMDLTNNSWGGGPPNEALKDAIEYANILFVAAAGNSYVDTDLSPQYPSGYNSENIITVAGINSSEDLIFE